MLVAAIKAVACEEAQSSAESNVIKIKEEKYDPEIEEKINATFLGCNSTSADSTDVKPRIRADGSIIIATEGQEQDDASSSDDSNEDTEEAEEKKSIEPVKSSNEILAELFNVFNAAPPEELLDDKNLIKKNKHKKAKKSKKKKKKKSKSETKSDGEQSDGSESNASSVTSNKRKKSKKHKHKDEERHTEKSKRKSKAKELEKSKEKSPVRHKEQVAVKVEKETTEESTSNHKRHSDDKHSRHSPKRSRISFSLNQHRQRERSKEVDRGHNSFYNGFRDNEHERKNSHNRDAERKSQSYHKETRIKKEPTDRHHSETDQKPRIAKDDGHASEISLSDEETYLKERNNVDTRRRHDGSSLPRHGSRYKTQNSFYAGAERCRSRSRERDRGGRYRNRSRPRSRSRSRDLGIDKKRLLEIARKNAISMFKRGNLPGCAEMTEEVKDKVLLKMRYGGRTVQDLTEFCKKLTNGKNLNDISDLSSDEDSDVDKGGNAKAFHHPFVIKEREPIVMHIRGSAPPSVVTKSDDQTKAITMQFPVSSGQQHRVTESWVPVQSKESLPPLPVLPAATQSTSIFKIAQEKNIFQKSMPPQLVQEPAFKSVNANTTELPPPLPPLVAPVALVPPPPPAPVVAPLPVPPVTSTAISAAPIPFVPDVPVPSVAPKDSVFPQAAAASIDVSNIISKRLNAMRRLQDNPMDSEALKMMYNSQKEMSSWANSKHMPGKFTGSTGANVLSARELNSGPQVWARRDQLTSTVPMTGGMGMQLLKKMGWKPGEGLGREKSGSLQPLLLDVKLDKRGLVSQEDTGPQRQRQCAAKKRRNVEQVQQNLEDKHPVSLLNELTSKRKWTPPLYTLVNEGGPSHSKMFMFSVSINGQTFTPTHGANTKKDAKVVAARYCLQQIGIIP